MSGPGSAEEAGADAGTGERPGAAGGLPSQAPDAAEPGPDSGAPAGRFWSARRVPAGLVALVLLGAAGLLLYDVAAVRAGRTAMAWRRWLAHELAVRHLDDPWVLGAAATATALGIWLLVLAVTPGLRAVLPMRRTAPGVRAGLDRSAAVLVLRDRAMEVSGVQSVRMTVGRRRARARAVAHFRALDVVRGDLGTVLGDGLRELGLARRLRLTVEVRRPKRR
ncbi:DUF6286 domain-containing protein [Streptomyces noursei]|uniref:DUF6286 domain-containing protein n=1 Tax=Streptomyces noursei TaxID=1971 RepID=UPI0016740755|nr:DUF6286 domain-containing protein [Streptomyces noursei]MCZ1015047.1 DUF6286 domain-containing protein [Streptomyces noursei]GGX02667.1 hypothetical protein GCM10010341_25360 [Streptomyces noursei]